MNRIDPKLAATLRQPAELVARGLVPASALAWGSHDTAGLFDSFYSATSTLSLDEPTPNSVNLISENDVALSPNFRRPLAHAVHTFSSGAN